ncbi:hypothetical protein [Geodermatophilus ruber]|uniref:hypothetical protein n=1 Tax=Geodermatophilus ruber TaxID=504800 RepID=UPI000B827C0B|nr:hypothetical protein [Geodermatophilus ruber]
MTSPDPHTEGRRAATELLRLIADGGSAKVDELLAGIPTIRELVFVGAGLSSIARTEGRQLPPAQRAQASTRQLNLGRLRDSHRSDPEGLRRWLRQAAEEILLIRSQLAVAERFAD